MNDFEATFQTDMTFSAFASVSVSERGEEIMHGGYSSAPLLDGVNDVEVSVGIEEGQEDGTVNLRFATYHAKHEESDRAFHFNADMDLSWKQVADLHRFLAYLLAINDAGSKR